MIYLDYSATTMVNEEVLKNFIHVNKNYIGNANSLHSLGIKSKHLVDSTTNEIKHILNIKNSEIIYTSGATESNNLSIKGVALKYKNRGKHIITTSLEHSSIIGTLGYLQKEGYEVDFVEFKKDGLIDLDHLKNLIKETTILVSISSVSSEIGILQPIEKIINLVKNYPNCILHVDMTQSIGKVDIPLDNIDLVSFSAHKFYGLKGIGCLVKGDNIDLEPIIHGGKSTTKYRSGTPSVPLIASVSKALEISYDEINKKYDNVRELNCYLKDKLSNLGVVINSTNSSIPHILNFSVVGLKSEKLVHAFEEKDIYISDQTACSSGNAKSKAVYALTKNEEIASSSVRISLSYHTTKEEIDSFIKALEQILANLGR